MGPHLGSRLLVVVDNEGVLWSELKILGKKRKNHENIIGTFVCAFCFKKYPPVN